ncbi:protein STICHEL-like 2 isoform X2 [Tripterygium wilfordii]|uniref:protein STICHEL-like 2 isoform X2 n=1 Tax=Tripterygium wilfordii TaxID=458696 RepID=UPI0018F82F15|nr:protein STICHEL-like 2 isoform X2 [Tripterygium wilfordii]
MTDGMRHSVDIPICRTLVALRRVKSLRDPSTSSASKFSALVDNLNWENSGNNGITLQFGSDFHGGGSDHNGHLRPRNISVSERIEEQVDDFDLRRSFGKSRLTSRENSCWEENVDAITVKQVELNKDEVHKDRSLSEKVCGNRRDEGLNLTCVMPISNPLEDVDSSTALDASKQKSPLRNQVKTSGALGDVSSRVGSPCPSTATGDALSSFSTPLFADEDVFDNNRAGCGIGCCWARTPRFRESNPYSDVEDHPLLSSDVNETGHFRQRNWKPTNKDITPYSETPRSLSQKFRPKFFDELVGHNAVVRSLLGAICRGRITSLYLFHGPRGTGKTSASRIFAAALNCLSREEQKPCGICRECNIFFSGKSKDVKDVDSVRINQNERVKSLMKNAVIPPVSSRFKVFIVDECHLLHGETWAVVLNSLDKLPQHVVFVMITSELDKLPQSAVTRSQKYHFPKIKDADIASRLGKICVEEGLEFDQVALDFIGAKSNGSVREAEMMLDQLSLLGKKITMALVYELIGIISEEELLDLLDLALSSDTSNTVVRARELMRSRIDPMQLMSQLANLIMDILAGEIEEDDTGARRNFSRRHNSEADMQKLSHALKILSETEKQLKVSRNQTTWLTVALLHLSSEPSLLDTNDLKSSSRTAHERDGACCITSSTGESLKPLVPCSRGDDNKPQKLGLQENCKVTLELIWKRATELCQSNSLKNFLRKQGKLSSVCVSQGMAIIELEFHRPHYVSRAEKSWKVIASSLQSILGCNVEIQINLALCPDLKCSNVKKPIFSFLSCSRRMPQKLRLNTQHGSESDISDYASGKPMITERSILSCSSDVGCQMHHGLCHGMESTKALRNSEGNLLSTGRILFRKSPQQDTQKSHRNEVDSQKEQGSSLECPETEDQPNCFPRILRLRKNSSDTSQMICMGNQQQNELALSICDPDPYIFCPSSNNCIDNSKEHGLEENALCWRTPAIPLNKALQPTNQPQRSSLIHRVLSCGAGR